MEIPELKNTVPERGKKKKISEWNEQHTGDGKRKDQ